QAIAGERAAWSERKDGAAAQIATIAERSTEAERERDELKDAPQRFAEMRQGLIGEIETATAARRDAANRRLGDIEHEIREMLEVEPSAAAELAELKPGAELPEVAEIEARLDRIRRERERLGSVNLLAEQELRAAEEQHTKLTGERDDLVEAIRRLRQGIHSLNSEARERLLTSFAIVNENFKKLFTELFGGGTAELQLIEH